MFEMKWFLFFRNDKMTSNRTVTIHPAASLHGGRNKIYHRNTSLQPCVSRPRGGDEDGEDANERGDVAAVETQPTGADRWPAAAAPSPRSSERSNLKDSGHCTVAKEGATSMCRGSSFINDCFCYLVSKSTEGSHGFPQ